MSDTAVSSQGAIFIPRSATRSSVNLRAYFVLTYIAMLLVGRGLPAEIKSFDFLTLLFAGATYLVYALLYLSPLLLIVAIVRLVCRRRWVQLRLARTPITPDAIVSTVAVLLGAALQVLLYADSFIFRLYGFHLNGFVWNLVFTRGGIASLGGSSATTWTFTLIILGFVLLQGGLLAASLRISALRRAADRALSRPVLVGLAVLAVAAFEQITYGVACIRGYQPVLVAADAFPLYIPLSFTRLAAKLGVEVVQRDNIRVNVDSIRLRYPLSPLRRDPAAKKHNIVWLVTESLRADMLDPEIMPAAWAFAQNSLWLKNHYSGGNGTRMGVFTMFYGLYGYYWFPFLDERRGPVLMDLLTDDGYQMHMYTGAGFSYPEFDKTVFARVPADRLHESIAFPIWKRDEENVSDMIDFIEKRDPQKPFMTYLFFESPHAEYHFPKEAAIRTPYEVNFNYATMDLKKDIGPIKNRYINACHYLDSQLKRLLDYLESRRLLDSTIVLFTGDHGEEFMEKGRWGHNSAFSQEQIRTPCFIRAPGRPPQQVAEMTSHIDFPATVLSALGVTNPPSDYSLGVDLFSNPRHDYLVLSDWNALTYINREYKVIFPLSSYDFINQKVTTLSDQPVPDRAAFFQANKDQIVEVMKRLKTFSK